MPYLKLKCAKCGRETEELVALGAKFPPCPACGEDALTREYTGKPLCGSGKKSGCSGSCATCGGCKK